MKRATFYYLTFLFLCANEVFAQSSLFNLAIDRKVKDSVLVLDIYIKKTSGPDFALGTSNFDINLQSPFLDMEHARFSGGEFDASSHPESYDPLGTSSKNFLVINVNAKVKSTGAGTLVSETPKKIGTVEIPILDPCATVTTKWSASNTSLNSYSKTAKSTSVKQNVLYIDPAAIDLDGGVSKTIPSISYSKDKLVSSSPDHNQWFLDGVLIPGATDSVFVPLIEGKYAVEVAYPCAKNMSAAYPVVATSLSNFSLSSNFVAQPNPFMGESIINYTLPNTSYVKLQMFDVKGTYKMDLESGIKQQGKHEFHLKFSELDLPAGTYVIKMVVGDKTGTLKIVALK